MRHGLLPRIVINNTISFPTRSGVCVAFASNNTTHMILDSTICHAEKIVAILLANVSSENPKGVKSLKKIVISCTFRNSLPLFALLPSHTNTNKHSFESRTWSHVIIFIDYLYFSPDDIHILINL